MIPLHVPPIRVREIIRFPKEDYVTKLRELFKEKLGKENVVFTANGRNAIHLALKSMMLGPRDEVIIPAYGCEAIRAAVERTCQPVYVDVDRRTNNMDPSQLIRSITKKTRAILMAHLYGNPCRIDSIIEFAKANNLLIIEDAAQALGGYYKGRMLGSFGDFTLFSFRFTKDIALLRGGVLLTNREISTTLQPLTPFWAFSGLFISLAAMHQIKRIPAKVYVPLREQILKPFFKKNAALFHPSNEGLTNYQCYLVYKQFGRIKSIIEKRRRNAAYYSEHLGDILTTPEAIKDSAHTYFRYTVQSDNRNGLYKHCLKYGIEVDKMYDYSLAPLPNSMAAGNKNLNIPVHQELEPNECERIASVIRQFKH